MIHEKMRKCFMNGKSCIYERVIGERLRNLASSEHERRAFVIMPFAPDLDAIYQWQLVPFLNRGGLDNDSSYKCTIVERADDVRQTGYIICEKICKKIQEADLVVVDLSFDNPNVFYEFGLSAALGKPILPICYDQCADASRRERLLKYFGIKDFLVCPSFGFLSGQISKYLYDVESGKRLDRWNGDRFTVVHDGSDITIPYRDTGPTMKYGFGKICVTAAATALNEIFSVENLKKKPELKHYNTDLVDKEPDGKYHPYIEPFDLDIEHTDYDRVVACFRKSYCAAFDVRSQHPAILFWLGYSHGLGEFAIPVNEIKRPQGATTVTAPAFDIVALWHAFFETTQPLSLSKNIKDILEFVLVEKSRKIQRTQFWKEILGSNEVSIFLGSLTVKELGRNTLGDWDYRTAAELTSFLTSEKETMEVTLESPIPKAPDRDANEEWLEGQLRDKNCIIVASPDVNDLTEVVLAKLYQKQAFRPISDEDSSFDGYIAYKRYGGGAGLAGAGLANEFGFASLRLLHDEKDQTNERGFIYRHGNRNSEKVVFEPHVFPDDGDGKIHKLLGLLVVMPNPFVTKGSPRKWIIVIDGISGPATLGIAQLLTGGKYLDFTVNRLRVSEPAENVRIRDVLTEAGSRFSPVLLPENRVEEGAEIYVPYDKISEKCLAEINPLLMEKPGAGVEALISVYVYYPGSGGKRRADERKIFAWQFSPVTNKDGVTIDNPRSRPSAQKP